MVSLAVSGFLAVLPVLIIWALQGKRYLAGFVGIVLFVVCATVSGSSAVGFAASNRERYGRRKGYRDRQIRVRSARVGRCGRQAQGAAANKASLCGGAGYRSREAASLLASLDRMSG